MTVRCIDVESTGTDPAIDAIIEIASVDLVRGGGITNQMRTLVNPGRPIPPVASAVHHITDGDAADAPPISEAIEQFKGADCYVAHSAVFDRAFLEAAGIGEAQWVCTYKAALRLWPDLDSHSNQALRYQFGLINPFGISRHEIQAHSALSDVIVTAAILERMMSEAAWSDMVAWSAEPALHTKFSFGKHRGERFDAVDLSYLDWITDKSDLSPDVKFSAAYWRRKRISGVKNEAAP